MLPRFCNMNWSMYLTQVKCLYLPWESASESQLQDIMPDVMWEFNWSFYSIKELNFLYFKFVHNSNVIPQYITISVWEQMWYMIQFACLILFEYLPFFWIRWIQAFADSMQVARASLQTLNMEMVNKIMKMLLTYVMVDAKQFIMMGVVACQRKHQ